jgi:hypothetical protein
MPQQLQALAPPASPSPPPPPTLVTITVTKGRRRRREAQATGGQYRVSYFFKCANGIEQESVYVANATTYTCVLRCDRAWK